MVYKRAGVELTTTVTPANNDGNDILVFTPTVDEIVSFAFPAQDGTGGSLTIGVRDIGTWAADAFCGVMVHTSGNLIASEIYAVLQQGVAVGGLLPGDGADIPAPTVIVPKVADQDPLDRAARHFPGITASARLAGAIHSTEISVTLSV